jgi:hypothetical protein
MINEIWIDIKNYEGIYQISNFGNVKSIMRIGKHNKGRKWQIRKERTLKNRNDGRGYYSVILYKGNTKISYRIHRLVAKAFIPNINNRPEINHKDGNKQNNNVDNLEWCTRKENTSHARQNGLYPKNARRLFNKNTVENIKSMIKQGFLNRYIADKLNTNIQNIRNIRIGHTYKYD